MPVQLGIWQIDGGLQPIEFSSLPQESQLEDVLATHPDILGEPLLVVGRQVLTAFGKYIDLLAVDGEGDLVIIELKRDRTPRDVVAQVLDYGSWVERLTYEDVTNLHAQYQSDIAFETSFAETFGADPPEALNESHRLVVVAGSLDPQTERIIGHLAETYGVPINAVFFRYFKQKGHEYIARTWLIDPVEAEATADRSRSPKRKKEPWNGRDFYVAIGDGEHRSWADCRRYGFVSAGQGEWYSKTLKALKPNHRVFACIPSTGYVGVGIVSEEACPVRDFQVEIDGQKTALLDAPLTATNMDDHADDDEKSEWVVRIDWIETRPAHEAVWAKGMFANQNSACRLRSRFTLENLVEAFDLDE